MSDPQSTHGTHVLHFTKYPYDNVHGYIGITELEREIIDTRIFQRLRRVKQLGLADLVFPGGTHTRFAHSLGSLFVMDAVLCRLLEQKCVDQADLQKLRLAALLHDVGHYPFSHVIEQVMRERHGDRAKHEPMSAHIITSTEIRDVLTKYGYNAEEIASIIQSTSNTKLFNYLLSSDLDIDKMDYLLRDAYHTGVAYGSIDIDRLFQTISVNKETNAQLAVLQKGKHAIENLLIGRYHMYQSVYYHKTVTAFELMLQSAYKRLLSEGYEGCPDLDTIKKMNEDELAGFDDSYVWRQIWQYEGKSQSLKELIEMLCERTSLKVTYEEPSFEAERTKGSVLKVLQVPMQRKMLSEESKVEEDWIFISTPPSSKTIISDDQETAIYIEKETNGKQYERIIDDNSSIVHHLARFRYLTSRVYTKQSLSSDLRAGLRKCYNI